MLSWQVHGETMLLSQLQAWIVCLASEHGVSLDGVDVGCGPQESREHMLSY